LKSANTVVAFNCLAKSSGVGKGVATEVNAAPKFVTGNTGGGGGRGAVGNPAIGRFGPKVCNVNCPVGVAANCANVGSGGGGGGADADGGGGADADGGGGADAGGGGGGGAGTPVNEGVDANCAGVGNGGGAGIPVGADTGVAAGNPIGAGGGGGAGAETGVAVGVAVGAVVGNTVAVPKGRVAKDATPVAGKGTDAVANGVVDSALPLGSFSNNRINTVLSSDSPNVSLDFCNLGIVFCT